MKAEEKNKSLSQKTIIMLGFNKEANLELAIQEKQNFSLMLLKLAGYLDASGNNGQSRYIEKLLELINQDDWDQFVNSLNSVNMWGGSGAVWEVYIADNIEAKKFQKAIIDLINLMESTKILKRGIAPIRQAFLMI